jgi:hypothetical protein
LKEQFVGRIITGQAGEIVEKKLDVQGQVAGLGQPWLKSCGYGWQSWFLEEKIINKDTRQNSSGGLRR